MTIIKGFLMLAILGRFPRMTASGNPNFCFGKILMLINIITNNLLTLNLSVILIDDKLKYVDFEAILFTLTII